MKWFVHAKQVLTAFFWGGTFIAGRYLANSVDPYHAAFLRFSIASIILFCVMVWKDGKLIFPSFSQFIELFVLGLSGVFIYNIFFFKGLQTVQAGRASLIIATNPVFISFLSALIFKEKLTVSKSSGILLSVVGAILVIADGRFEEIFSGALGWGEFFIFLCVASWVTYSLVGKRVMKQLSPFQTVTWSSLIGTILLFPVAWINGLKDQIYHIPLPQWGALFYLGFFGTVLGFFWYYQGIEVLGAMKTSLYINLVPVSAILLAFIFLHESISFWLVTGLLLILSGIFLTNVAGRIFSGAVFRFIKNQTS